MITAAERLDDQWDHSFAEFQAWVTQTGGLPSRRSNEADEYRLANWLNRQRTDSRKEAIDPERERLLRTIPGALEAPGLRLSDVVLADRVRSFHATHGRLPRRAVEGESTVAGYLARLRAMTRTGAISAEALSAFEAITGALEAPGLRLSDVVVADRVRSFHATHGRLPRRAVEGERAVAGYLARLRAMTRAGAISAEALSAFEAIPGAVTASKRSFTAEERLEQVGEYLSEHGRLPQSSEEGGMRRWIWKALRGEASVNREKAERVRVAVEKLVEGNPAALRLKPARRSRPTAAGYIASLEEYVAAHGHLPSSGHGSTPMFQRDRLIELLASPATCEAEAARIRALLSTPSWQRGNIGGAERIAAFYDENGWLPRKGSSPSERRLADLLVRLRARERSGRMTPAAIEALRSVPGALPPRKTFG